VPVSKNHPELEPFIEAMAELLASSFLNEQKKRAKSPARPARFKGCYEHEKYSKNQNTVAPAEND